ncbi:MAG: LCP family protein [Clostridia bacterium]|nr:LCP family protein [Clostridia bacterium]
MSRRKKRSKKTNRRRMVFVILLVIFITSGIYIADTVHAILNPDRLLSVQNKDQEEELEGLQDDGDQTSRDLINIVLLGFDGDTNRQNKMGVFRSDTIVLASINMKTKEVAMISIPRDTRTLIKKLNKDGTVNTEFMDKINHAFAYGWGRNKYSYDNSMDAISNLLGGIPIHYYVGIDMDAVKAIVDAVGGVDMYVDVTYTKGSYNLHEGQTHLDGELALQYVRFRKTAGGDIDRTKRQQNFIKAFLVKLKSMNPIVTVPRLYSNLRGYVDTNLNIKDMAALAVLLNDLDVDEIKVRNIEGTGRYINGVSYWIPDREKLDQLIREQFREDEGNIIDDEVINYDSTGAESY